MSPQLLSGSARWWRGVAVCSRRGAWPWGPTEGPGPAVHTLGGSVQADQGLAWPAAGGPIRPVVFN